MDSITQGLLGAATAQLGFRQRIGRDASWVAAVAAWSPDWDVFFPAGHLERMLVHRGPTHSLLFVPLIAAAFALPWWAIRRRIAHRRETHGTGANRQSPIDNRQSPPPPFWLLYACCFVAVLSHSLLDWCTSYGTLLLWPISSARLALDAVGIVDLLYTGILVATLLLCYVRRRVRRPGAARATRVAGWAGLLLSTAYLVAGLGLNRLAVAKALRHVGDEADAASARAYPMIGTILLWRVTVRTDDGWAVVRIHHLADGTSPPRSATVAEAAENPWTRRARTTRAYEMLRWFAMGQVRTEYAEVGGNHVVRFHDMRYAMSADETESLWPVEITYDEAGKLISTTRHSPRRRGGLWRAVGNIWAEMWEP